MLDERIEWLTTQGREILNQVQGFAASDLAVHRLSDWQRGLLVEQLSYRKRASRRFPFPDRWLWTDRSLAQASDWWSATFVASLFPASCEMLDACCGSGANLVAFASERRATGVDRDSNLLALAKANLAAHELSASILNADFADLQVDSRTWLHIDPDRRSDSGARTTAASAFSPPVAEFLPAAMRARGAVVKLAPSTIFRDTELSSIEERSQRVWIGNMGECRQQLIVAGEACDNLRSAMQDNPIGDIGKDESPRDTDARFGSHDRRIAVLAEPDQDFKSSGDRHFFSADEAEDAEVVLTTKAFVYELHSTLRAAGLQEAFANEFGLQALTSSDGYFTSDEPITSPWVQRFQVLSIVGWDDRKVRKALRAADAGLVEVKSQLLKLDANHFQRRYSSSDGRPITLLVTRLGKRTQAILATRL